MIHLGTEIPQIVLAPGTHEQAFAITGSQLRMFTNVLSLSSQISIADAQRTTGLDFDSLPSTANGHL